MANFEDQEGTETQFTDLSNDVQVLYDDERYTYDDVQVQYE